MNVDIESILDQIKDAAVMETETASIELPDFNKYGLSYQISEPLGSDNEWKTTYDDTGEYTVKITVEGKGFKGEKDAKITVKNKDRAPKLVDLGNIKAKEGEQLSIELKAIDPDKDPVIFSVEDAPENSGLSGNVFTWTPGYDFVQKDNALGYILDKFRLLGKSANVVFKAQSNELSDEKNVEITVKDVNKPFVFGVIEDIATNEGEEIVIDPKYDDPDKDKVSFSYSGFMDSNKKTASYDDAGNYVVKVTATDGFNTETRFVNVRDVNRKPVFNKIENVEVSEGNEIRIELSASDPDNDAISFSAEALPKGAKLKDNLFVWTPEFDAVNGTQKEFSVDFIASDGMDEDIKKAKITVLNVNQPPKITDFSDNSVVLKGKPALFEVNAADGDGDKLAYSWDFGLFDKYEGNNQHQRIFTITGKKKVEVTVSDGLETVSKVWNVEVI